MRDRSGEAAMWLVEADRRGVTIDALPTPDACRMLVYLKPKEVRAVLHVTC